jgi:hypothetical protein
MRFKKSRFFERVSNLQMPPSLVSSDIKRIGAEQSNSLTRFANL